MQDTQIEDIIVPRPETCYVKRAGAENWEVYPITPFESWDAMRDLINSKADFQGDAKPINYANPKIDAQLPDGSRLHAVMSPLTKDPGPVITIRRHRKGVAKDINALLKMDHMGSGAAKFLKCLMVARRSIGILGGTASGKTTMINALLTEAADYERIVTCEDTLEVDLARGIWTQLKTKDARREANLDGFDITALVRECLRMRPDRIVVGEVRDGAMGAVLQAGNTGHDGMLFTVHANDTFAGIERMEVLTRMNPTMSSMSNFDVRRMITTALHYLVHVAFVRLPDGRYVRRLMSISEIQGIQGDMVDLSEIFKYDPLDKFVGERSKQMNRAVFTGSLPRRSWDYLEQTNPGAQSARHS